MWITGAVGRVCAGTHLDVSRSQLGELAQYELLNLRRWAHMLGFRGHFLTKPRAYSVTIGACTCREQCHDL